MSLVAIGVALAMIQAQAAVPALGAADRNAAFAAAGFVRRGNQWRSDCNDPGTASYSPGTIETVGDFNGDGQPDALITEGSSFCYGGTGMGFVLVSRNAGGQWRRMVKAQGVAAMLPTRGVANWPDIEIGGPGFCFPVVRWNGTAYVHHRRHYEGRPCS